MKRSPKTTYQRGPCFSESQPITGEIIVGITTGRKIRPAPEQSHLVKARLPRSGIVASRPPNGTISMREP